MRQLKNNHNAFRAFSVLHKLAALAALLVAANSHAAQPMRFETLGVDDGLSQGAVVTILQDSSGKMWFGTEDGLNVYDGYQFQTFRSERDETGTLSYDYVWSLAEDREGNIWVGTDGGGVEIWQPELERFVHLEDYLSVGDLDLTSEKIRSIIVDQAGDIWVATRSSGVFHVDYESRRLQHYIHDAANPLSLSSDEVHAILEDRSGTIWIGTEEGLNRFDPESASFQRFTHDPADDQSLANNSVQSLAQDHRGAIWVGTDKGLHRLIPNVDGFIRYQYSEEDARSLSGDIVNVILEDSERRLWIGTNRGLNLYDRQTGDFTRYQQTNGDPSGLPENNVISLYQDRSGLLWIGMKTAGVAKWNPRSWSLGYYNGSLDGDFLLKGVTSFTEDTSGAVWIGTLESGLVSFDKKTGEIQPVAAKSLAHLKDTPVMALAADFEGNIWIGTMRHGVTRYDPRTRKAAIFRHQPDNINTLGSNGIMTLMVDAEGIVWAGTFGGGVARFRADLGTFERVNSLPGSDIDLSQTRVAALAEDLFGTIWVGTDGDGLFSMDLANGTVHQFLPEEQNLASISSPSIWALHVDAEGEVWVGSRGAGLDRVVGSSREPGSIRFRNWSEKDGLSNDVIYGIHSDLNGNIWLSSNRGLMRLDPESDAIKVFRRSHGLQGDEFNFGAHYQTPDGQLFFGGPHGFNTFFPQRIDRNDHKPPVVLTEVQKFNKPMDLQLNTLEKLLLGYEDDVITFEFAALDYTAPAENRYAYKLEGFDDNWVTSGNRRRATYTNLSGGVYTFRVLAANSDGVWNSEGLSIPVVVENPPWLRWWAFVLYAVAVLLIIGFLFRLYRLRAQREAEYRERLENEVRVRTQELADRNDQLNDMNRRLQDASLTDPLTQLRNRRFLLEEVVHTLKARPQHGAERRALPDEEQHSTYFMMVDLDYFKPINDTHGHDAGDQMLLQITESLIQNTRSTDHVIRWGGDEFLIVCPNSTIGDAESMAERIRSAISRRVYALGNGSIARTSCSIGFAPYPFVQHIPDLFSWEQVLKLADAAVYDAKQHRNAWTGVVAGMNLVPRDNLCDEITTDLVKAGEENLVRVLTNAAVTGIFEMREA